MEMNVTLNRGILVKMVNLAIDCKKQIRIKYTDAKGDKTVRFVEPIKFMHATNGLGILTKCNEREGNYRHFKVDKIDRILITDYNFQWVNPDTEK